MSEKVKALLATGRISNLPTVWCNCLAAGLLLIHSYPSVLEFYTDSGSCSIYLVGIILMLSTSLLYVGGCFLGDAIDSNFDKEHKPERPIPSGVLEKKSIFRLSIIMLGIGTLLPAAFHFIGNAFIFPLDNKVTAYGWQQLTAVPFLALAIILYSVYHKRYPVIGLPLIGLCRFFLIIFAASITAWLATKYELTLDLTPTEHALTASYLLQPIILFAASVCLYTICFASVARTEASDSPITWRNILRYTMLSLPFVALISKTQFQSEYLANTAIIALAIYALWLLRAFQFLERNKGIYVSKCLAGFCLLDACFVAQFGWIWLILCLILFCASLLLQRIAPAT